jgi:hypothetical protein
MKILLLDYSVTEDGVITSHKYGKNKILKQYLNSNGYLCVKADNKQQKVHSLVASKYVDGYSDLCNTVNHKDGNKLNNHYSNLEWVSRKDNLYHAMDNGLHAWGRSGVIGTSIKDGSNLFFASIAEAARNGFTQPNISKCLAGQRKVCKGYTWRLA